jgi:hypothetical protein
MSAIRAATVYRNIRVTARHRHTVLLLIPMKVQGLHELRFPWIGYDGADAEILTGKNDLPIEMI